MSLPAAGAMWARRAIGWLTGVALATKERMAGAAASHERCSSVIWRGPPAPLVGGDATADVAGRGVPRALVIGPLTGDLDFPASNALTCAIALPSLPAYGCAHHIL